MNQPTVVSCKILPPRNWGKLLQRDVDGSDGELQDDYQATVVATMSDGQSDVVVLRYFNDELTFRPDEFVGLNQEQISDLFRRKDIEYLRS